MKSSSNLKWEDRRRTNVTKIVGYKKGGVDIRFSRAYWTIFTESTGKLRKQLI